MKKHHAWVIALATLVAVAIILYASRLGDDDEITKRAVDALRNHPILDSSGLQVTLDKGVATITGQVADQESKRIAIEAVQEITGVDRVIDKISVAVESAGETGSDDPPPEPTKDE